VPTSGVRWQPWCSLCWTARQQPLGGACPLLEPPPQLNLVKNCWPWALQLPARALRGWRGAVRGLSPCCCCQRGGWHCPWVYSLYFAALRPAGTRRTPRRLRPLDRDPGVGWCCFLLPSCQPRPSGLGLTLISPGRGGGGRSGNQPRCGALPSPPGTPPSEWFCLLGLSGLLCGSGGACSRRRCGCWPLISGPHCKSAPCRLAASGGGVVCRCFAHLPVQGLGRGWPDHAWPLVPGGPH